MSSSDQLLSNSSSASTPAAGGPGKRTLLFVAAAVACVGITTEIDISSRPAPIKEFGRIGEQFYPEFTDPTLAAALEVYAFDKEEVVPREFVVERLENGRWSIPSHHNYPTDAEDQLAKTAASVIGIKRGAMVTRWPADHAKYGVVNPKQGSLKVDEVEGVGKRLILKGDADAILADYIIGNQPESDQSNDYYVRDPDEDAVYLATLSIDLSTKFEDWIDTDLLHISQSDLVQLTINDYAFDEAQGTINKGATILLKREKSSDPWVLEGLNEETEEVDKAAMTAAVGAIDNMKIVGVREKKGGLTPDLKIDRKAIQSQNDFQIVQSDLMTKGFLLQPDEQPETLKLIASEGELHSTTSDGLVYQMYFGRAFTGSQEELEIGITADESATETKNTEEETDSDDETPETEADGEKDSDSNKQPGRYVFVKVDFEEANLGERPVEPVAPEMPEELQQPAEPKEVDADAVAADSEEVATEEPVTDEADSDSDAEAEGEKPEEDPLAPIREEYESAKKNHEIDMVTYESDVKAFEKKVADGIKKAEDLNRRFAEWYYVVPGETFDKLRLTREDIVKEKEQPKSEEGAADSPADPSEAKTETAKPKEPAPTEDGEADPKPKEETAEEKADTVEEAAKPTEEEPSSEELKTDETPEESAPETEPAAGTE